MPSYEIPPPGSKAAYIRVPEPPRTWTPTSKNTTNKNFNRPNVKAARFQHGGVAAEIDAYNAGLNISFPDIPANKDRFSAEQQLFDLADRAEVESFGPQRPRSQNYDPRIAPGQQYNNLSDMPIDYLEDRRGGVYSTGEPVNTMFSSFVDDPDLVEDPTTSTNVSRPRTVAAAYTPDEQKLTVVFLDNTYYNYYEVTMGEWQKFKQSYSKGEYILSDLNAKPRGVASLGDVPEELLKHSFLSTRLTQIGRLTKSHAHQGKFKPAQAMKIPNKRNFSKIATYTPQYPNRPRGRNVPKQSQVHAPSSKTARAAAARAATRRGMYGK